MALFTTRPCCSRSVRSNIFHSLVVPVATLLLAGGSFAMSTFPSVAPEEVGLPATLTAKLNHVLKEAIEVGATAGAEALVLSGDRTVYHEAFGWARKGPNPIPLQKGTTFDVASLTKMVATLPSVLVLVDEGKIRLDAPAWSYLKPFAQAGKESVTVRQLLTHTSGLPGYIQFFKEISGRRAYLAAVCSTPLESLPGEKRVYSDLGYMTLGWIVESVARKPLDWFAAEKVFHPLGMTQTGYRVPLAARPKTAATEVRPGTGKLIQGTVHDENAEALGGVSGHAGLFSTARDLAIYARMILLGGEFGGERILSEASVREMMTDQNVPSDTPQALGWWYRNPLDQATVFLASDHAFGHTGFTGVSLWMDPDHDMVAILLANSIHPHREQSDAKLFRRPFHRVLTDALKGRGTSLP